MTPSSSSTMLQEEAASEAIFVFFFFDDASGGGGLSLSLQCLCVCLFFLRRCFRGGGLWKRPCSSLFSSTMLQEEGLRKRSHVVFVFFDDASGGGGLLEEELGFALLSRFQTTSRGEEENQKLSDPFFQVLLFEHC